MKIRMLGTGYGICGIKNHFSKEYRGRGGVLIDDALLIDAPDDVFDVADGLGFGDIFNTVTDVIISHSHSGHFSAAAIIRLARKRKIRVFASESVLRAIPENERIEKYKISSLQQFSVGRYNITALPANHATDNPLEECFNFLVLSDRTLFYALDGGFICTRGFNILKQVKLDAVICDAAILDSPDCEESIFHNNIDGILKVKRIYESCGIASEKTKFFLSHIPTDKHRETHSELSAPLAKQGLILLYDGYFVRL